MDFDYSEEESMLQDATRRLLASEYGFEARAARLASGRPSAQVWAQLAGLGLLTLEVPEAHGGLETGPFAMLAVCQAMGEALLVEPYIESALTATRAIALHGSAEQRERWLPLLASGSLIAVVAHPPLEPTGRLPTVVALDAGCLLHGELDAVDFGACADLLLVPAVNVRGDLGLYALQAGSSGLRVSGTPTVDGRERARIELEDVWVPAADCLGSDLAAGLVALRDHALAAHCADTLGALERGFRSTVEYARTRQQFGQPIGRFQALQHRLADLFMRVEEARSMAMLAAARCADPDPQVRFDALSAAKLVIGRAARDVGQEAVQIHGGMGMSDELDVSHVFRRLLGFELRFGSASAHRRERARRLAATGATATT